jgi:NADH-quinone oxidoreductase subunit M
VFGLVASAGVVLASVYMIRVFQRMMHNRVGPKVESRELCKLDFAVLAPLAALIIAFGVYPQAILDKSRGATASQIKAAAAVGEPVADAAEPAADPAQQVPGGATGPGGEQLTPEQIQQLQQQLQQQGGAP